MLVPPQVDLLRPVEFLWADEEFEDDLVFNPAPTAEVATVYTPKEQPLTPTEIEELLKPIEFSWADEEFEDDLVFTPASTAEVTTVYVPKEQLLTPAEIAEFLKPIEFSWADEEFDDNSIATLAAPTSIEEATKRKGCNGGAAWCSTRQHLNTLGLVADNGFTLNDQIENTGAGGPLYIDSERLLCLYRPKELKHKKLFVSL